MIARLFAVALTASLSAAVSAETPNIEPGNWEYTSRVSFQSQFPIPEQSDTSTNCVTEEDINKGDAFMQEMDGCTITNRDVRSDGVDYSMNCDSGDGTSMTMDASIEFNGDTMEGTISGEMQSPMGPMQMNVAMTGRRIGDC